MGAEFAYGRGPHGYGLLSASSGAEDLFRRLALDTYCTDLPPEDCPAWFFHVNTGGDYLLGKNFEVEEAGRREHRCLLRYYPQNEADALLRQPEALFFPGTASLYIAYADCFIQELLSLEQKLPHLLAQVMAAMLENRPIRLSLELHGGCNSLVAHWLMTMVFRSLPYFGRKHFSYLSGMAERQEAPYHRYDVLFSGEGAPLVSGTLPPDWAGALSHGFLTQQDTGLKSLFFTSETPPESLEALNPLFEKSKDYAEKVLGRLRTEASRKMILDNPKLYKSILGQFLESGAADTSDAEALCRAMENRRGSPFLPEEDLPHALYLLRKDVPDTVRESYARCFFIPPERLFNGLLQHIEEMPEWALPVAFSFYLTYGGRLLTDQRMKAVTQAFLTRTELPDEESCLKGLMAFLREN